MNKGSVFSYFLRPSMFIVIVGVLIAVVVINLQVSISTLNDFKKLHKSIGNSSNIIFAIEDAKLALTVFDRALLVSQQENTFFSSSTLTQLTLRVAEKSEYITSFSSDDAKQQQRINRFRDSIENYMYETKLFIENPQQRDFQASQRLIQGDFIIPVQQTFEKLAISEKEFRKKQIADLEDKVVQARHNQFVSFGLSLIAIFAVMLLGRYILLAQRKERDTIEKRNKNLEEAVKERTQTLTLYSEELARSNRELEDFAFVASHDLQEPLRKIQTFSDRLAVQFSQDIDPKAQNYLTRMKSAAERMSTLINDLLEFSRVRTSQRKFELVDINKVVAEVKEDLSHVIEESRTQFLVDTFPTLNADPLQMRQLFYNLIANALKFSAKSEQPIVTVEVESCDMPTGCSQQHSVDWFKFIITDNGIGFDQEFADKIFAPFQRLHNKNDYAGTGIGLAICRRIAERHGGKIKASGEVRRGSVFTLFLPQNPASYPQK